MLASFPASMVNQKPADLGIQNRFNLTTSRFRQSSRSEVRPNCRCTPFRKSKAKHFSSRIKTTENYILLRCTQKLMLSSGAYALASA
jgi:hypothetical protein